MEECEGGEVLEQVSQRDGAYSASGNIQDQAGEAYSNLI